MFWNQDRLNRLEQMWLAGVPSSGIARAMAPIGRDAVMGKINRLGLMGRKGQGGMPDASDDDVRAAVALALARAAAHHVDGAPRALGMEDEYAVVQTAFRTGRAAPRLAELACADVARARAIVDRLDRTGIWPRDGHPPVGWFETDESGESPEMITDLMVLSGHLVRTGHGPDAIYGLTAKGMALAEDGDEPPAIPYDEARPVVRQLAQDIMDADLERGRDLPYDMDGLLVVLAGLHANLEHDAVKALTGVESARITQAIDMLDATGAWPRGSDLPSGDVDDEALPAYVRVLAAIATSDSLR